MKRTYTVTFEIENQDDMEAYERFMHGDKALNILNDTLLNLRNTLKYDEKMSNETRTKLEELRKFIYDQTNELEIPSSLVY